MLEEKLHTIDPAKITVRKGTTRQRKDLGKIQKLVESFEEFGQLQPIVVDRDLNLIAGGRRLAACVLGGFQAKICYSDEVDPLKLQEMELEENVQRKDLTPAEESIAIANLVQLRQARLGKPTQGREGGATLDSIGEAIGKTKGTIIDAIKIADMVKSFPDLAEAKTKSEIKAAYKGLQRVQSNIEALSTFEELIKTNKSFNIVNANAVEHMLTVEDSSIDLLFTDPPYGIDIDKMAISVGGHTGGKLTTTGIKYDDSAENALYLYEVLAKESVRFCKDNAHAYVFCGPSHFQAIKEMFNGAGWICSERPVIWIKAGSGQNNNPDAWFSSAYEMLLFARKPESKLVLWGQPDWIQCNKVTNTERTHQAEKPMELCKELISRVSKPGQKMYDPFIGSGALIESACEMKLFPLGCELAVESYATAVARMTKWQEKPKEVENDV